MSGRRKKEEGRGKESDGRSPRGEESEL